jgi:hypothetical protein
VPLHLPLAMHAHMHVRDADLTPPAVRSVLTVGSSKKA